MRYSLKRLIENQSGLMALASFLLGFAWSWWRAAPIDTTLSLCLQAISLLIILLLIIGEMAEKSSRLTLPPPLQSWWSWHPFVMHFLLGGLLRSYTVFFIKSASPLGAWAFLIFCFALLLANELPFVQSRGLPVRSALWALNSACFVTYLIPQLTHNLGSRFFYLSIVFAALTIYLLQLTMKPIASQALRYRCFFWPGLVSLITYLALYFLALIPPVPLMLTRFEVTTQLMKSNQLWSYATPRDDTLWTHSVWPQQGERVHALFRLVAPPLFIETLYVSWEWKSPESGWTRTDHIPVTIQGGRREGFRGSTDKIQYWPGEWRVLLLTEDNREIGRRHFWIHAKKPRQVIEYTAHEL